MFPLRIALPLALAASLFAAAPAGATGGPLVRAASQDRGHVQARVAGTVRTGAWRLAVTRTGSAERLRVFIERGDIWWGGKVIVQQQVDGRWETTQRRRLDHEGRLRRTLCGTELGACVVAGSVLAPHPGAQRLGASFRLEGHGTWSFTGSIRQATEPFILGPWEPGTVERLTF